MYEQQEQMIGNMLQCIQLVKQTCELEVCTGTGMVEIPQNSGFPADIGMNVAGIPRGGSDNCRIPVGWILLRWNGNGWGWI